MAHARRTLAQLRERILDGAELALLDVREARPFVASHILTASNAPLSRLEIVMPRLVPRKAAPVVLCDADESIVDRATQVLAGQGYHDVSVLQGGTLAWAAAGYVLFEGSNVPSKAFGEIVEIACHTPAMDAKEVKQRVDDGDDLIILDGRPWDEYQDFNIPGGIDCPNSELAYRVRDLVPDPQTTIIVNCAGRTRSIIGAQTLRNAGVPNPVFALRNGTIGWEWAGLALEHGADRRHGAVSQGALQWSHDQCTHLAQRANVTVIGLDELQAWRAEAENQTLYVFDVREPEEFATGSLAGAVSAQGTQLVQATDEYLAVRAGRIVLVDDTGVRSCMTASWLKQLGFPNVAVLDVDVRDHAVSAQPNAAPDAPSIFAKEAFESGHRIVDLSLSLRFMEAHPKDAVWGLRSSLQDITARLDTGTPVAVLDDENGHLAALAAAELTELGYSARVLDGGLDAWRIAGCPVDSGRKGMASPILDTLDMPFDLTGDPEAAKRAYIDWELQLPDQIERDGLLSFSPLQAP
ncbi:MAG: rhodanese-like domain-containing protein [Alphaproteobacteria bacterium]|jgi:rhodanese-related sulfurtransferase